MMGQRTKADFTNSPCLLSNGSYHEAIIGAQSAFFGGLKPDVCESHPREFNLRQSNSHLSPCTYPLPCTQWVLARIWGP